MDNYTVYCHENLTNRKRYFGITCQPLHQRWRNGNGYRNNDFFYRAIQKYGWNGFEHLVIQDGLSKKEAESLEIKLINDYDTTNPSKGYNIEKGGSGANRITDETRNKIRHALKGHICSEETRLKISIANTGKRNPNKGKRMTAELVEKNRISHLGQIPWNKGRPWSESERAKCNGKAVVCVETGTIFSTAHNAGRALKIDFSSINKCCRGRAKTAGGYHWKYLTAEEWSLPNG